MRGWFGLKRTLIVSTGAVVLVAICAADKGSKPAIIRTLLHRSERKKANSRQQLLSSCHPLQVLRSTPQLHRYLHLRCDGAEQDPLGSLQTIRNSSSSTILDLTGRIPDSNKIRKFLVDKDPDKRDKLIDNIISPERFEFQEEDAFVDRWTYWFNDLFGNSGGKSGHPGPRYYMTDYIRFSLRLNVPYNEMVEETVPSASALTNWFSGPANS